MVDPIPAHPHPTTPAAASPPHAPLTLDQLVRDHHPHITRTVRRLLGWAGDADDVTQEVFLAALKHLPRFRGDSTPRTWLTAIAIRRCRAQRRKWWKRPRPGPPIDPTAPPNPPDDDTAQAVRAAVRQLPLPLREVIVLHYLEDMPAHDIAAVLNATENAVYVRLHRARKHLGTLLADFNEDS